MIFNIIASFSSSNPFSNFYCSSMSIKSNDQQLQAAEVSNDMEPRKIAKTSCVKVIFFCNKQ